MNISKIAQIEFPKFSGIRCLMMPYIQGDAESVPEQYRAYESILNTVCFKKGDIGYLTIDESPVVAGSPHRGARAKYGRALHTEAGRIPEGMYAWGRPPSWGGSHTTLLDTDVEILLANSIDESCALWDTNHGNTSLDGDIGDYAQDYPYSAAQLMRAGEVYRIGILTPHESLPIRKNGNRQFLRIVSSGVHGREPYFTENPLMPSAPPTA